MSAIGTYTVPENIDVCSGPGTGKVIGKLDEGDIVEITDIIWSGKKFLCVWFFNSKKQRVKGWIPQHVDARIPSKKLVGLVDTNTVPGIMGTRPNREAELEEKRKPRKSRGK